MQWVERYIKWIPVIMLGWSLASCETSGSASSSSDDQPKSFQGLRKMALVPANDSISTFYIDTDPVTYLDFRKYVRGGGNIGAYWDEATYNVSDQPITGINWYHAADYCNWRSKMEGFTPAYEISETLDAWGYPGLKLNPKANGYRLPNEAEFIWAASAGKPANRYPWGNHFSPRLANYDNELGVKKGKWWRLAKVNELPANEWGIRGMSGNVWHWCNDWYIPNRTKVLKGGSWGSISPNFLQVSYRTYSAPSNYNFDIGFRCIRPVQKLTEKKDKRKSGLNLSPKHRFYQYQTSHYQQFSKVDYYHPAFTQRLARFLGDYFPQSLYFLQQVDEQPQLTPLQLAEEIITVTRQYKINPLFLTAIMVSESGVGSCSFPRWYNNPMAFHWQNKLMPKGLPVYDARPGIRNRKYRVLRDAFEAFCKGIRRNLYYKAALENLYDFHMIYVGYESDTWLYTIARVFKDVAGIRFEADEPMQNAGAYIYLDWDKILSGQTKLNKPLNPGKQNQKNTSPRIAPKATTKVSSARYFLIAGSYTQRSVAQRKLSDLKEAGFNNAHIIQTPRRFRVAFDKGYQARSSAIVVKKALRGAYNDIWIWRKR